MKEETAYADVPASGANARANLDDNVQSEDLPQDELIISLKADSAQERLNVYFDSLIKKHGNQFTKTVLCTLCGGKSFLLLKGRSISSYISDGGPVTGGTLSTEDIGITGEDGPVYVSRNYRVKFKGDAVSRLPVLPRQAGNYSISGPPVKVAVFDTGIDPEELNGFSFTSSHSSCLPGADAGYNFIKGNANFKDNNEMKHGSTVTRFITDQVVKYGRNRVEILPVKTHNKNGVSDLAHLFCAFSYAAERKVNIINASFGFYIPRLRKYSQPQDGDIRLLREFIRYFLTRNKILLVTAAGNRDDEQVAAAFSRYGLTAPANHRNFDSAAFYPAFLAHNQGLPNVIAVTTVNQAAVFVSPNQNYSDSVVDIGVMADTVLIYPVSGEKRFVFDHPRLGGTETVDGSSYAAPILTGILSAHYDLLRERFQQDSNNTPGQEISKEQIWSILGNRIVRTRPALSGQVKGGRFVQK